MIMDYKKLFHDEVAFQHINRNYNMSTKTIELNPSLLATGKADN